MAAEKSNEYRQLVEDCQKTFALNTKLEVIIVSSLGAAPSETVHTVRRLARCNARKANLISKRFSIVALRESFKLYEKSLEPASVNSTDASTTADVGSDSDADEPPTLFVNQSSSDDGSSSPQSSIEADELLEPEVLSSSSTDDSASAPLDSQRTSVAPCLRFFYVLYEVLNRFLLFLLFPIVSLVETFLLPIPYAFFLFFFLCSLNFSIYFWSHFSQFYSHFLGSLIYFTLLVF